MMRRYVIKKLSVTTLALLVILLYVVFPTKNNEEFNISVNRINNGETSFVYLMDENNYVTMSKVFLDSDKEKDKIFEKLSILTKNSSYEDKVPNKFASVIPENTKINGINIDNNTIKIDFSKELLNVTKENEEHMIEAIIFTLTEDNDYRNIIISVEGSILDKLPNSKKALPTPLTRKYGINKKYDITSLNNITTTTVYYLNNIDGSNCYTPVSLINNDNSEKIDIIINELKSTSIYQNSLKSLLNVDANLDSYNIDDEVMTLVFSGDLTNGNDANILESVKYTISSSIKENYDVDKVVIKIK